MTEPAPGFNIDYDYHPFQNKRGYHTTLVSPELSELNPLFKDFADIFSVNLRRQGNGSAIGREMGVKCPGFVGADSTRNPALTPRYSINLHCNWSLGGP